MDTAESYTYIAEPTEIIELMGYEKDWDGVAAFLQEFGTRELEFWLGDQAFMWNKARRGPVALATPVPEVEDPSSLLVLFAPSDVPGGPRRLRPDIKLSQEEQLALVAQLFRAGFPAYYHYELNIVMPVLIEGGIDAIDPLEWQGGGPRPTNRAVFELELRASSRAMKWYTPEG